jgi:AraC-like DNA-binding protein
MKQTDGIVRIGPWMAILEVLRSFGLDPADVLAEARIDPELFLDGDNTISYAARGRLVAVCVKRTGCRHFGLLVGQRARLSSLGLVGFLVQHSQDIGSALRRLVRYLHLHVRGAALNLAIQDDLAILDYTIYQPGLQAVEQTGDGAVALMVNILRELCGPDFVPTEIRLAHSAPRDPGPYRKFFRAPIRFDAKHYAVVFRASWLDHRIATDAPELLRMLQARVDELEADDRQAFPDLVRRVLRPALLTGNASEAQIARLFAVHPRTLHRRLAAFDTSFRELLEEGRYAYARQMLADSRMELGEVASHLGYSEPSAFTRAFRRWSGFAPSQWRRQARAKTGKVARRSRP